MGHFAKVIDGIVETVLVADQNFIDSGAVGDPNNWIQTSYNTRGGIHYAPNSNEPDSGIALRKNYPGIGFTYDKVRDAFIAQTPYSSWLLDEDTCQWVPPVADPMDGKGPYKWDEDVENWVKS